MNSKAGKYKHSHEESWKYTLLCAWAEDSVLHNRGCMSSGARGQPPWRHRCEVMKRKCVNNSWKIKGYINTFHHYMSELFTMIINWGLPPLGFKRNASFRAFDNIFTDGFFPQEGLQSHAVRVHKISTQLLGPYLLMNLFSPIWTPECASSILGDHGRGWETEEQHRELIISPIWFSLMTPHDQQPAISDQQAEEVKLCRVNSDHVHVRHWLPR